MKDGRVDRTSAFVRAEPDLSGIPNSVRRDREALRRRLHKPPEDENSGGWLNHAEHARAQEDTTIAFPAPRLDGGPTHDELGRPMRRRRGGRVN